MILSFLRTIPSIAYAVSILALSLLLNLHQFGQARAAEAECRAKIAETQLQAKAAADKEQAERQKSIDQLAIDDAHESRETLAQIAAGVERSTYNLRKAANAAPVADSCRVSAERVRVVNTALSVPRAARPTL